MISYRINSGDIRNAIYIPKYYDPSIRNELGRLRSSHDLYSISSLAQNGVISISTGDEIGKSAYGTGDIPFVRTSDITNWEIKSFPKQGVSKEIYNLYAIGQDVRIGDILLVRDGTYLIGRNCFITAIDKDIIYQSHILKIRIKKPDELAPELFFLSLNSPIVQKQIRSVQFTADIIDTLGQRVGEIILPIPKNDETRKSLKGSVSNALGTRLKGKAFIKNAPYIMEAVLEKNSLTPMDNFLSLSLEKMAEIISSRTVTAEFGEFENFWLCSADVRNSIFLPKYYDPSIHEELKKLEKYCDLKSMGQLRREKMIGYHTGVEIGKMAYGTGDIPFIRTSDFSNWEVLHEPKQGVSEEIYKIYANGLDLQEEDILLVRDGTYLIGSSCIVTKHDVKSLFCGGLFKIRVKNNTELDPYLFLGLLNSFIVKRQIRTKQFTRDVIDTIGNRIDEVFIPIPKDQKIRQKISETVEGVINSRIINRNEIGKLASVISK